MLLSEHPLAAAESTVLGSVQDTISFCVARKTKVQTIIAPLLLQGKQGNMQFTSMANFLMADK